MNSQSNMQGSIFQDNRMYNMYILEGVTNEDSEANVKLLCNKVVVWLGKALDEISEITFELYVTEKLEYKETRVYFSDKLILYTIKLMEYIAASYPELWSRHK